MARSRLDYRAILLVLTLAMAAVPAPLFPAPLFRRGDANTDAASDLSDAISVLGQLFLGNTKVPCEKAADANDDGKLDISDGVFILSFLFLGSQPPPSPFPDCGEDLTGDGLGCEAYSVCPQESLTEILVGLDGILLDQADYRLYIPPGALESEVLITIRVEDEDSESLLAQLPGPRALTGKAIRLGPPGLKFLHPILVSVRTRTVVEEGEVLPLLFLDDATSAWDQAEDDEDRPSYAWASETGQWFSFYTDHFSSYTVYLPNLPTDLFAWSNKWTRIQLENGDKLPFIVPGYLYLNGTPPDLTLLDGNFREDTYYAVLLDLVLQTQIAREGDLAGFTEEVLDFLEQFDGDPAKLSQKVLKIAAAIPLVRAGDVAQKISKAIPKALLGIQIGTILANNIGKQLLKALIFNELDFDRAFAELQLIEDSVKRSTLGADTRLTAALDRVRKKVEQEYDRVQQGVTAVILARTWEGAWSTVWDLAVKFGIPLGLEKSIAIALGGGALATGVVVVSAYIVTDYVTKDLVVARRNGARLAVLGTLFFYLDVFEEVRGHLMRTDAPGRKFEVPDPLFICDQADRDRWGKNELALYTLWQIAEISSKTVLLTDQSFVTKTLRINAEKLSDAAANLFKAGAGDTEQTRKQNAAILTEIGIEAAKLYGKIHAANYGSCSPAPIPEECRGTASPLELNLLRRITTCTGKIDGFVFAAPSATAGYRVRLTSRGAQVGLFVSGNPVAMRAIPASCFALDCGWRLKIGGEVALDLPFDGGDPSRSYIAVLGQTDGAYEIVVEGTTPPVSIQPEIAVSPPMGPRGTEFTITGSRFTPASRAYLSLKQPAREEASPMGRPVDAQGSWTFVFSTHAGSAVGTYRVSARDERTGRVTAEKTFEVLGPRPVSPRVTVSPSQLVQGEGTFAQNGSGFTPGGLARLHFRDPDGIELSGPEKTVGADGKFQHSNAPPPDAILGQYAFWAEDLASGRKAPEAVYWIVAEVDPQVTVEPIRLVRCQGTFSQDGTGFTPEGLARLHFRKPDLSEFPPLEKAVGSGGSFEHTYSPPSDATTGEYAYWAEDVSTGRHSAAVSFWIDPGERLPCPGQEWTNSIGMKLVWIPPGSFLMGSPEGERGRLDREGPVHKVNLSQGFYIGATEVTQGQYLEVMGTNPSSFNEGDWGVDLSRPVEQVSWFDALEFLGRLSAREGRAYNLPTEAQWEHVARAGTTTAFSFGDILECDYVCGPCPVADEYLWWCGNNSNTGTKPVGRKKPNPWGLFDMHGNVWEWCRDSWDGTGSPYNALEVTDPQGTSGMFRILRGGDWENFLTGSRSAYRLNGDPDVRYAHIVGFRVVLVAGLPGG